jgi:hypothetical protein
MPTSSEWKFRTLNVILNIDNQDIVISNFIKRTAKITELKSTVQMTWKCGKGTKYLRLETDSNVWSTSNTLVPVGLCLIESEDANKYSFEI